MTHNTISKVDERSWGDWLAINRPHLLRYAGTLVARRRTISAEDLLHESLVRLWKQNLKRNEVGVQPMPVVLYNLKLTVIDMSRKDSRRIRRESAFEAQFEVFHPTVYHPWEGKEGSRDVRDRLESLLTKLPPLQAEVVSLRTLEDLDMGQIAERLGISYNTVAARWRYGIQALRRLLSDAKASDLAGRKVRLPTPGAGAPIDHRSRMTNGSWPST